ncbi:acetyl-CoA synthetase-like protein [Armillaria gallica]|uniref:Acetyl-CoA synthetase-like protein n=1 Tax=Armillaria gallica TaxID=47427 RepID=A0A2H3EQD7_ARMGA|nr:acetyl-CoA synthetase-like protein [Armillaria gallica]
MSFSTQRLIPPPPQKQGEKSATFRSPPIDGSFTLQQMYDWHLVNSANHRIFVYARDDGSTRTIYWPEAIAAIYTGARLMKRRILARHKRPVVAILSMSDTITYFTTMMSLLRANFILFPISPRNSALAVAHLLHKVEVQYVLVGRDVSMQDLARDSLDILKSQYSYSLDDLPNLSPVPVFEELFLQHWQDGLSKSDDLPLTSVDPDAIVLYLHSSGSTAYPKPIPWSSHRIVQLCLIPWFGGRDLCNVVFSLHVMPMYHGMGVLQLCWTASSGLVVSAFEPKSPAMLPTPENLFASARAAQSDVIFCVPSFIEAWSRRPEYVEWLATRSGVLYGGGPLNKEAGDHLTSKGVSIFILYGSTEGGIMSPILPAQVGYDWEYFEFPKLVTPEMVASGNNAYELVMVANKFCRPSVINTKVDGNDSYSTSDLFIPHPTKAGFWKIFGRTDDQIMHNTGEKTNPGPLENMLNQDPHVLASVFFGRGKFQAGVLIEPKTRFAFDPNDESKIAEFRNKIWPTVERINKFAPQHSRLFKEMILVAKPGKPFTYTAKNTARRQAILDDYSEEITAIYKTVEESTQANIPPPLEWDDISTKEFVRTVVFQVLSHSISEDEDLFQHGCDSLQATWIRNTLLRALRDTAEFDTRQTTDNFVYSHPSISQLATFLHSVAQGTHTPSVGLGSRVENMHAMVSKYSKDSPVMSKKHCGSLALKTGKVVLLTGTTGALGCHILASLVSDQTVGHIYAVNRPGKISVQERQRRALIDHGIDINMEKVIMLEVDLSSESQLFSDEVTSSVTHIIHNAWRVDFNLGLSSFESNIRGVRHLIELALTSKARLIYTSSIGVFQNAAEDHPLTETHIDPHIAEGTGYSESKWVSEELLRLVSGLRYLVVRVGQLAGGPRGTWNPKEWVPSMIQSSTVLGCLPDDEQLVSWLPVHMAAQMIVDSVDISPHIMHLVHPNPIPWATIARIISRELNVNLVSYTHWLEALENLAVHPTSLPAIRLLPYYRRSALALGWKNREAFGLPHLVTSSDKGQELSPLDKDEVENWLKYWRGENIF